MQREEVYRVPHCGNSDLYGYRGYLNRLIGYLSVFRRVRRRSIRTGKDRVVDGSVAVVANTSFNLAAYITGCPRSSATNGIRTVPRHTLYRNQITRHR